MGGLCHLTVIPTVMTVTSEAKVVMILDKRADCHVSALNANAELDRQAGSDQIVYI